MNQSVRRTASAALLTVFCSCVDAAPASRSHYPTRPVRLIVPFAPGGGSDIMGRIIAQKMSEPLGQPVVVDNRAGGGSTIGSEIAVRAAPDGYTLLLNTGSYATNAALYKLPYDPINDIDCIVLLGESGFVAAVHPSVPIKSIEELIAYNKAAPGKINYASTGTGGITHLNAELFILLSGTKMTHIPYKGTGPALNDLLGGQVQLIFGSMPATLPHVRTGKLRAIGVTTPKRIAPLPQVPAIGEAVGGYESVVYYGISGPKGTSKDIVGLWNREVAKILKTEEMKKHLEADALEPGGGPPEQLLNALKRDVEKWKKVVKEAKIAVSL